MGHQAPTLEKKGETKEHQPFISADKDIPEFTVKAVVLGCIFGLIFGAVTVYLALRAGLTVSASIPIAVLAIAVFKKIGKSTILENNMVQTIGSAGESIAAGVVFTIPAFLFIAGDGKDYFHYMEIMTLAAVGGILGVLMMVPMRRALIVQEHNNLVYPEGKACAEVLIAGEKGGAMAKTVFAGFWIGILYTVLMKIGKLWRDVFQFAAGPTGTYKNATLTSEITAEYLGVGYIIGPRISGIMVSGSVLAWLALIPLLSMLVPTATVHTDLGKLGFSQGWIDGHSQADWYYRAYIRYIGAGAVAMAGMMTLLKNLPKIIGSMRGSMKSVGAGQAGGVVKRTDRDIPMKWVLIGCVGLVAVMAALPNLPTGAFPNSLVTAILILLFGFFFVAVSSRIVGEIGSSSNPISGMTIATLLGTCLIFLSLGMGGDLYQGAALCVGAIVCISAANAGATSQDLKTGYLVGATPIRQQVGLIIGVVVSVLAIGYTLMLLDSAYAPAGVEGGHGIGGEKLPAPQGTLMATIIKGVLSQDLPWGFIFIGAAMSLMIQLCGISGLAWAVGLYLPISTTFPIFIGGGIRWLGDKIRGEKDESELSSGMLFATGLVAAGSIGGLLYAILSSIESFKPTMNGLGSFGEHLNLFNIFGESAQWSGLVMCGVLGFFLYRWSQKKLEM